MTAEPAKHRFLTIEQVAGELNTKTSLIRTLIQTGQLRAFQVGARGLWRVGRLDLENYIAEGYRRTAERIAAGELTDDLPDEHEES